MLGAEVHNLTVGMRGEEDVERGGERCGNGGRGGRGEIVTR